MIPLTITGIPQFQFQSKDLDAARHFYQTLLGLSPLAREAHSLSLGMAAGRVDVYERPYDSELHAENASAVGSQNLCFRASGDPEEAMAYLRSAGADLIEEQLHDRSGALGPMKSFYLFDSDHNLVELAFYEKKNRPMQLLAIDHLVLVSADYRRSLDFYEALCGAVQRSEGHGVIQTGRQKLNVHHLKPRYTPHEPYAAIGSVTCTLTAAGNSALVKSELEALGLSYREDRSALCLFDPDGNLLRLMPEGGA